MEGPSDLIESIMFLTNGGRVVSGSKRCTIWILDMNTDKPSTWTIMLVPSHSQLLAVFSDSWGKAHLDLECGKTKAVMGPLEGSSDSVPSLILPTDDGRIIFWL